jgi:hypothetical protein
MHPDLKITKEEFFWPLYIYIYIYIYICFKNNLYMIKITILGIPNSRNVLRCVYVCV